MQDFSENVFAAMHDVAPRTDLQWVRIRYRIGVFVGTGEGRASVVQAVDTRSLLVTGFDDSPRGVHGVRIEKYRLFRVCVIVPP